MASTLTVTSTKDSSAVTDVAQDPYDAWNGGDNHHPIGRWNSSFVSGSKTFDWKGRGLSYFPISFTGINSIESAKLWFRQRNGGHCDPSNGNTGLRVKLYRMVRDWTEPDYGESSWTSGTAYKWSTRAEQTTGGVANWVTEGFADKTFTQVNDGWVEVDVLSIVTAWWNHSKGVRSDAPNYGVIFVNNDEATRNNGFDIYTRESGASYAPYVVITYNSNQAPTAIVEGTRSPNGSSGSPTLLNTLTPTFVAALADPDLPDDYITKVGIVVREHPSNTLMWDSGGMTIAGKPTSYSIQYGAVAGNYLAPLVGNKQYLWTTNVMDKGGVWCAWSQWDHFKTNTPPNAPTVSILETPSNDVRTLTPTVVITHNDPDPGDTVAYGYQYIVEKVTGATAWSYDSTGVELGVGERATTKQVVMPTLQNADGSAWGTQYRVKSRTKDANGAWGAYSGWSSFTTHKTGTPINLAPTASENTTGTTPYLSADRATSADVIASYQIYLYDDDALTVVWNSGTKTTGIASGGASFAYLYNGAALTAGNYYQWKVMLTSTIGGDSAYSALSRFRVPNDATQPTPTSPITAGISGGGSDKQRPAFTAQRAGTFNRYKIEVYPATANTGNVGSYISGASVDATHYWDSTSRSSTITGTGPYVATMAADVVPALNWATTYKWRVAVSADAGSTWSAWSGLTAFTMDTAGSPTLDSPTPNQWITDATPTFQINGSGAEVIDKMRVRVYASNNTTLIWDSLLIDVTESGGVATIDYGDLTGGAAAAPTLTGDWYYWDALYQRSTGPTGAYATRQRFRLNSAPSVPTELEPEQGAVVRESVTPIFAARFNDNDIQDMGDTPNGWDIEVQYWNGSAWAAHDTETITANLVVGVNYYTWAGTALSYGTDYQWRTRFRDSKSVWGSWSSYRLFNCAVEPSSVMDLPTEGDTINVRRPTIEWTYDAQGGTAQDGFRLTITKITDNTTDPVPTLDDLLAGTSGEIITPVVVITKDGYSTGSYQLETIYLADQNVYEFTIEVKNLDGLYDPSPSVNRAKTVFDAPDPIEGLAPTVLEEKSLVQLNWTAVANPPKANHTFLNYNIYKRLAGGEDWTLIGAVYSRTAPTYDDWYAGNGVAYEYFVTVVTSKTGSGAELESGAGEGSICETQLTSDVWMLVGADRAANHIRELPVDDEDHEAIIQQEAFETLGANRKVIIRGFVLGDEGSISMTWMNVDVPLPEDDQVTINETVMGRLLLDYLISNAGPHILKSPFGDVWDVQIEGPKYKWLPVGHLQAEVSWTETGNNNTLGL